MEKAVASGISLVAFDRSGYKYHGESWLLPMVLQSRFSILREESLRYEHNTPEEEKLVEKS